MNAAGTRQVDRVILGAGIFGLHAARVCCARGEKVLTLEADPEPFGRASTINQARLHLGYHYPRSLSTAQASVAFYDRFMSEFSGAIHRNFKKIYAISQGNSHASATEFLRFCQHLSLPVKEVSPDLYFNPGTVEAAFETEEKAFDAGIIKAQLLSQVTAPILTGTRVTNVERERDCFVLALSDGSTVRTPWVLNATYAAINQVLALFGAAPFPVKYELAEVALGEPSPDLRGLGVTLMDGPFFSTMPFGLTGLHSLTAVEYTPHLSTPGPLPRFSCQSLTNSCSPEVLRNCNVCPDRPGSSHPRMSRLAREYLQERFSLTIQESRFAIKAILLDSETDDARPTLIRCEPGDGPRLLSVLAGKINTLYELDEWLNVDQSR